MNGVRWSRELDAYEGRCDACLEHYPLERDFWPVDGRGVRICRACDNLKTKVRLAERRKNDPAFREAGRLRSKAYWAAMSPEERRILKRSHLPDLDRKRAYQREWMRRDRAGRAA